MIFQKKKKKHIIIIAFLVVIDNPDHYCRIKKRRKSYVKNKKRYNILISIFGILDYTYA